MTSITRTARIASFFMDAAVLIAFFVLFFEVGDGFSFYVFYFSFAVFLLYAVVSTMAKRSVFRGIPIAIDTRLVFTLFYYMLFFHPYMLHVLGLEDYRISAFLPYVYENGANKALCVSVIGYVGFCSGLRCAIRFTTNRRYGPLTSIEYRFFDRFFFVFFSLVMGVYVFSGLESADIGRYSNPDAGSVAGDGLYVVLVMLSVLGISRAVQTLAIGKPLRVEHWLILLVSGYWATNILVGGDRNNFLIIALAAVGGAAAFLSKVRWPTILLLCVGGLTLYNVIEILRMMPEISVSGIVEAYELSNQKEAGGSSFGNTTATLRATFDITPELVPYGMGLYKLIGLMGIVPLVRGYIFADFGGFTATAGPLTFYMIGPYAGWGVGSNVLSDIYMDFGLFGVPVLMFALGTFVTSVNIQLRNRGATPILVFVYMILIGTVGEIPRYSYDLPVRMVAWGVGLLFAFEFMFGRARR